MTFQLVIMASHSFAVSIGDKNLINCESQFCEIQELCTLSWDLGENKIKFLLVLIARKSNCKVGGVRERNHM
jgi:hypothetical protein